MESRESVWSSEVNELGWQGPSAEDENVVALITHLRDNNSGVKDENGINMMDKLAVNPFEVDRAAEIFHQCGFVIIKNALNSQELKLLRKGVEKAVQEIMEIDKERKGNRGSHRYSFGSSSLTNSLTHWPEWAQLIDLNTTGPILRRLLGEGYHCRSVGGDFVLPGCVNYQRMHQDINRTHTVEHEGVSKPIVEAPCYMIAVNFVPQDFTSLNGPIHHILADEDGNPTQTSSRYPPSLENESEEWKLSTLMPCKAGSCIVRDPRAWHGSTPNVRKELRAIPNVEYYAEWHVPNQNLFLQEFRKSMPLDVYETLSPEGQRLCEHIVAPRDELQLGWRTEQFQ